MADVLVSAAFAFISIFMFFSTGRFPELNINDPGPALFPKMLSVILLVLSVALLLSAVFKRRKAVFFEHGWKKVLFTVLLLLLYYFSLDILGFLVSTSLFLIILIRYLEKRNLLHDVAISVGFTFLIYSVFQLLLNVPLPEFGI